MDVIENPILTFSALSLIIILLAASLFILRTRLVVLENKFVDTGNSNQARFDQLEEILISSLEKTENSSRKSSEQLLKALSGQIEVCTNDISNSVQTSQSLIENSTLQMVHESEQKIAELISSATERVASVAENVKNNAMYTRGVVERSGLKLSGEISGTEKTLVEIINNATKKLVAEGETRFSELKSVKTELADKIENSLKEQTLEIINNTNEVTDSTKELITGSADDLINALELVRVSNVLTESRNLYDRGRLVLETEAFVKTFDSCQLTQVEDKETGQVTKNEYQDGQISASKTYRTDSLEYVGHYQNGLLTKMEDLTGPEGSKVTQYEYDEAGEVETII